MPILKRHEGLRPVTFDERGGADPNSIVGLYVPVGYSAQYRYVMSPEAGRGCGAEAGKEFSEWTVYDLKESGNNTVTPLALGEAGAKLPALAPRQCLLIQWRLDPAPQRGNTSHLFEQPFVAANGVEYLPQTNVVEGDAPGPEGGGISLSVSADFGAVGKDFRIKTAGGRYISIIHNIGAPTDDGMVWGIALTGAKGLYNANDDANDVGSSAFCGHPDDGTPFSHTMWGMKTPLVQSGQSLTMARSCQGAECFIPMYSDFTTASKRFGGTFPFMLPRSVEPWDGQVNKIAVEDVKTANGAPSAVERLIYSYNYRSHMTFTAKTANPHLWFNQAITDAADHDRRRPVDIYLVHGDNSSTKLAYHDLVDDNGGAAWDAFCKNDGHKEHCSANPRHEGDVTCQCGYRDPDIKRVVYDYTEDRVAISMQPAEERFQAFYVGTLHHRNVHGRPSVLTSASNAYVKTPTTFEENGPVKTDTYIFNVGTLRALTEAGLGR